MTTLLNVSITTSSSGMSAVYQTRNPREVPRNLLLQGLLTIAAVSSLGTGLNAWVQTSIDGRNSFFDIANFGSTAVTTGTITRVANLSAATPVTTEFAPVNVSIATSSVQDGCLGAFYRVQWAATGTYGAGSGIRIDAAGLELVASGS